MRSYFPAARALVVLAVAATLAACDLPTAIPQVDQRWIIPPTTTTIGVASLLPAGVRTTADSTAFTVDVASASVSRALSQDCAQCAAANGTTVAKPAFVAVANTSTALPAGISSATLAAGTLEVDLANGYDFDPLRPSATARGYVVVIVTNGTTVIGRDSVDGAALALPAGATLTRAVPIAGPLTGSAPISVTVRLVSPAGDPVRIDATETLSATVAASGLRVPSAAIALVSREVSTTFTSDLRDIDATLTSHITGGAVLLDVANPFDAGGPFAVRFSAPNGANITKNVVLASGTTHLAIPMTGDELQSLFGQVVTVTFSGPVTATAATIAVAPRQAIVVTSRLDVTLHTGG